MLLDPEEVELHSPADEGPLVPRARKRVKARWLRLCTSTIHAEVETNAHAGRGSGLGKGDGHNEEGAKGHGGHGHKGEGRRDEGHWKEGIEGRRRARDEERERERERENSEREEGREGHGMDIRTKGGRDEEKAVRRTLGQWKREGRREEGHRDEEKRDIGTKRRGS